ncbi:MAG TPA: MMPL family transporter, partial [Nannocystaceae bacterium]|nr:MMPL family transporter [Nannocystaceae bacterium]
MLAHHRSILVIALFVTIAAGFLATKLRVDTDLRRLLPDGHPVLVALEHIEETFGTTGSVNVVIKHGPKEARHAFVDALEAELTGHPLLREVDTRLPSEFFIHHALYYLSEAEMEALDHKVQAYTHYEFCSRAADTCLLPPDPNAPEALEQFIERKRGESLERTGFRDRYEREGIDATIVLLHPTEPAARLDFARKVSEQMRAAIAEVYARPDMPWSGTEMVYNVVGPYTNKADEQATIKRDMLQGGIIGLVGVVGIIYLLFRSLRAVLVLLVPLAFGVAWSLGLTEIVLGRLNLMTSLISTVLMGMGIDAGIHFYTRAKIDRRKHDDAEAIKRAFHSLIIPLFVASGTTIGAFLVMSTSEFPAFREFGMISAWGVALCMLAMCTVLPALLYLVGIKRFEEPLPHREGAWMRKLLAHPGLMFALVVIVTVVSFQGVRRLEFEYNGRALQSDRARRESEPDTHLISEIFGKDIHAGILVRDSLEDTRVALALARRRHEARVAAGDSVVASLFAAPDLLPSPDIDLAARKVAIEEMYAENEDTFEKLEAIAEGKDVVETPAVGAVGDDWDDIEGDDAPAPKPAPAPAPKPAPKRTDGDEKGKLSQDEARALVDMFRAQPFTIDDLPAELLRKVRTESGAYAVFAYPDFDAADMRLGVQFTRETSGYVSDPGALFVGETTVYATMFEMLQEEAPIVLGMASVLIAAFVYWQLRSLPLTLLTLLPLC